MARLTLCKLVLAVAMLLSCAAGSRAQSFSQTHAKVDLIAEDNAVVPGGTLWIGVLFDLDRGWHTYWVNPGDSGAPPRFKWTLPAGFRTGDVRYPVPVRIGTGTVVDYGYEGRLLLALPLQVPANYVAGKPLQLATEVKFLVCSDVCIPATATPKLTIPAAGDAAARRQIFTAARGRWPKPPPPGWKVTATEQGDHLVLNVETGSRETQAAFFPLGEDEVDNATLPVVAPADRGAKITLKKSDLLDKPLTTLKGVLVLSSNRAIEISAPVTRAR